MGPYAKVGAVIIRSLGLLIMVYTIPILLWGILRIASGATMASDGRTPIRASFLGWLFYGLAGALLFLLAKPLGRLAARGFDEPGAMPRA